MDVLTIRDMPEDVASALDKECRRRGEPLDATVLHLLRQALDLGVSRSNGLAGMAGGWTQKEFDAFEQATATFEEVDPERAV